MRFKSYFAASVESAMQAARNELGPEAMIFSSRKAPTEGRHLGAYEVVFATEDPAEQAAAPAAAPVSAPAPAPVFASVSAPAAAPASENAIAVEMAFLRTQFNALRRELTQSWRPEFGPGAAAQALARAYDRLLSTDMDTGEAQRVIKGAQANLEAEAECNVSANAGSALMLRRPAADEDTATRAVVSVLENSFTVDSNAAGRSSGPSVIALVGPPGAGKTTCLAKLAVNFGLRLRRRTQLLSLDNYRVGAAAQLRSYASIIGVGYETLQTTHALAQALEEYRNRLVLIDTAGCSAGDLADNSELARFLSRRTDIATHLVLPASMKAADMNRVYDAFAPFGVSRLLFTKLDETETFGPILSVAARTGLPLSYFSTGQRVPEDMEQATKAKLMSLVWSEAERDLEMSVVA
jgi:flagellar biosynthesis protein FlhF